MTTMLRVGSLLIHYGWYISRSSPLYPNEASCVPFANPARIRYFTSLRPIFSKSDKTKHSQHELNLNCNFSNLPFIGKLSPTQR